MLTIRTISGGGNQSLLDTDDGKMIEVDATAGNTTLLLPDSTTLDAGWHIPWLHKGDSTSNLAGYMVTRSGDTLNHFWDISAPYPLWMNLTQQASELIYVGDGKFRLAGKTFHRNVPQSQRTFVSTNSPLLESFNVRPQDVNEVIQINASQRAMGVYFDPVAHFTRGGYMSCVVEFVRMDASGNNCRIFAASGEGINGQPYVDLNGIYTKIRCYIDSARITLL